MTTETVKTLAIYDSKVFVARFSPDGKYLATGEIAGMTLWNSTTWQPEHHLESTEIGRCMAFAKHSPVMVVGTVFDHDVEVWNPQTWKCGKKYGGFEQEVISVSLDDAGRLAAANTGFGQLKVWDLQKKRRVFSYEPPIHDMEAVALSPSGAFLRTGHAETATRL